jgi:anti-sigma factor RsiW
MRPTDSNDPAITDGAALWASAAQRFAAPAGEPLDELTLAAYLDGRLDQVGRDRVEGLLAADPLALERFLAADAAVGATQALPPALLARAQRLVPADAENRFGFLGRLLGGRDRSGGFRLRPSLLAASLAAILLVSVVGFELGRFGYAVAEEAYFPERDSLAQVATTAF